MSTVPSDITVERAMCSLALTTLGEAYDTAAQRLGPESFHDPECSLIWRAVGRLRNASETVTEFAVELELRGRVESASILSLTNRVHDPYDVPKFVARIEEMYRRRRLIAACHLAETLARDVSRDQAEITAEAERALYDALRTVRAREPWRPTAEVVDRVAHENAHTAAERGRMAGLATGIYGIDHHLRGMRKNELIVIGGRTSEGKSALANTIVRNVGIRGTRSAYFSCEMPAEDLVRRIVASDGVPIRQQESYDYCMSLDGSRKLARSYAHAASLPVEIVYQPKITIPQVRTWCRRFLTTGPLGLIVIDYLALLGSNEKHENRNRELASHTGACLELAAEFDVPVIAIQSLNRKSAFDGKPVRPQISHLMDSSAIEYDAHKILLVWNPTANDNESATDSGDREVIIAKNRSARRDIVVPVKFMGDRFLFADPEMTSRSDDEHNN